MKHRTRRTRRSPKARKTRKTKQHGGIRLEETVTRFGVELETCILVKEGECVWPHEVELNEEIEDSWYDLKDTFKGHFIQYLYGIIKNSETFEYVKEKYGMIVVYSGKKDRRPFLFDLHNLFVEETVLRYEEGHRNNINSNSNNKSQYGGFSYEEEFKYPIVMGDESIICGNSIGMTRKALGFPKDDYNHSFAFELITPVLEIKGPVTPEAVRKELEPLLRFFGLGTFSDCFIQNFSMGYHVNVSMEEGGKEVPLTKAPYFNRVLKHYIGKERNMYPLARSMKSPFHTSENMYVSHFAKPWFQKYNQKRMEKPDISNNDIVSGILENSEQEGTKYMSLHKKPLEILEFRIFETSNQIDKLIQNTLDAVQIVQEALT